VVVVGRVGRVVVVVGRVLTGNGVLDSKTGRLYLIDGGEVGWFNKSIQSAGFLFPVLVIFSPVVPTTKILNNKTF
jgi:hypothetical protein